MDPQNEDILIRNFLRNKVDMLYYCTLLALVLVIVQIQAGEDDHMYDLGNSVQLYFNKVGPYHNPQETYTYFSLPFCGNGDSSGSGSGDDGNSNNGGIKYAGLGEVLEGHGMYHFCC